MGYPTKFKLSVSSIIKDEKQILLAAQSLSLDAQYCLNLDGSSNESASWYDHELDMKKLSNKYPYALLTLEGEGEESGDLWKKYFLNGKMQVARAKITFEDFDVSKLESF